MEKQPSQGDKDYAQEKFFIQMYGNGGAEFGRFDIYFPVDEKEGPCCHSSQVVEGNIKKHLSFLVHRIGCLRRSI